MMRSGFLTNTEEARNNGSAQKTKATFDPTLILVGRHQLLIRELLALQFIGPDNETSLAQDFFVHPLLIDGHDLPLVGRRVILFARTPLACMASMSDDLMVNLQPHRLALQCPLQTSLSTADLPLQ